MIAASRRLYRRFACAYPHDVLWNAECAPTFVFARVILGLASDANGELKWHVGASVEASALLSDEFHAMSLSATTGGRPETKSVCATFGRY